MANKTNSKHTKTNAKQNSKRHSNSSKLLIGTALAVLLLLVVSTYGTQLSGWPVAIGTDSTAPRDPITISAVTLDAITLPGGTYSFSAIKANTTGTYYKWGNRIDGGIYLTNSVWILTKNRTAAGSSLVGSVIYMNDSGQYTIAYTPTTSASFSNIFTLVDLYTPSGENTLQDLSVKLEAGRTTRDRSRMITARIELTESAAYGTASLQDTWIFYYVFGTSSSGSPTAVDGHFQFRDAAGRVSRISRLVTYRYGVGGSANSPLPYCSPLGSCINRPDATESQITVRYATQQQSRN